MRAYRRARPTAHSHEPGAWLAHISETDRGRFRQLGMALVRSLLAYLDADKEHEATLLETAERQAREYGFQAVNAGASLSDTVQGFLRFRRPLIDELAVLARRRRLDTREATDLLIQAESALDRLLVALMLGHKA